MLSFLDNPLLAIIPRTTEERTHVTIELMVNETGCTAFTYLTWTTDTGPTLWAFRRSRPRPRVLHGLVDPWTSSSVSFFWQGRTPPSLFVCFTFIESRKRHKRLCFQRRQENLPQYLLVRYSMPRMPYFLLQLSSVCLPLRSSPLQRCLPPVICQVLG